MPRLLTLKMTALRARDLIARLSMTATVGQALSIRADLQSDVEQKGQLKRFFVSAVRILSEEGDRLQTVLGRETIGGNSDLEPCIPL